MASGSNLPPQREQQPPGRTWVMMIFAAILSVLLFLLAQSMVQHRFFRGQRVHQNGSLGQ